MQPKLENSLHCLNAYITRSSAIATLYVSKFMLCFTRYGS